jgi:uncharacterized protein YjbJ (UPF0337 family)
MGPFKSIFSKAFTIKGDWNLQAKRLTEKFSKLTDADLKFEEGKEEELLMRIEKRLNKKRDDVISLIKKEQPVGVWN